MKVHKESFLNLQRLYHETSEKALSPKTKYVIFSDLHLGNGGKSDDFKPNSALVIRSLEDYFEQGYTLILNGDIEELQRFSLTDIQQAWPEFYDLLRSFHGEGRLLKLIGNHDSILPGIRDYPFPVYDALRFSWKGNTIFIFHGHQTIRRFQKENEILTFILRHLATPLGIKNYSVSHSSSKRFTTEKRVYQFSSISRVMSVIGHTHRPLFESMSKVDTIRFEIERLCRKYPSVSESKKKNIRGAIEDLKKDLTQIIESEDELATRRSLYNANLVVPCMFNSGTTIGKRGITCLEIESGEIVLKHWFDRGRSKRYLTYETIPAHPLGSSNYYYIEIKRDSLDYIFSRIQLLGGPEMAGNLGNFEDFSDLLSRD
ncbi:metallophosphoesterase [Spirochaeta lutea]|uniref:metallophosphoesterase n=1 Tax=Spirochaeta lutea TaxID=1480694 RepID=UPI00068C42E0|nr:metallophosphoesterase [Spirochaeta lutea]